MGPTILRQWTLLSMLPRPPRRIDSASLEALLRARGYDVHRRTIQRDLVQLSEVFAIVADERNKPYGWRWREGATLPSGAFALTEQAGEENTDVSRAGDLAYLGIVGQRTPTETLFGIVAAFVEKREWTQAELARKLETTTETIRRRLGELKAGGFKLERFEEPPHVYWSVPKNWFPGVLPFKADEAPDLLRLLGRARPSELRERLFTIVISRLSNLGQTVDVDREAFRGPAVNDGDERWLTLVEDAITKKTALKMRYFTASRRHESWRHVSVHRVDSGVRTHFVGTCHTANALRRFRVSNVLEARLDPGETVRSVDAKALARFEQESFGGFRQDGPRVRCAFVVRDPESAWVARNLPDDAVAQEVVAEGIRFRVETPAVLVLARFVVGLGGAARSETPELAEHVADLARGALARSDVRGPKRAPR